MKDKDFEKSLDEVLSSQEGIEELFSTLPKGTYERAENLYGVKTQNFTGAQKRSVVATYISAAKKVHKDLLAHTAPIPMKVRKLEGFSDYYDILAEVYREQGRL